MATGSENTWIDAPTLTALGVTPEKKSVRFMTADPARKRLIAAGPLPAAACA